MIKNVHANLLKHLGAMSSFDLDLGSIEQGYVINWDMQYKKLVLHSKYLKFQFSAMVKV